MVRVTIRAYGPAVVVLVLAFAIAALPAPAYAGAPGADGANYSAIDAYIEAQMADLQLPGVALGIVQGDQIVHLKGFGVADPSGRAVTPQTPFVIGSLNKPITALAVMQLVEEGKVELDSPVQRYIPWFRVADEQASARITVRHLMTQTSGLGGTAGIESAASGDLSDDVVERRVRELQTVQLAHPVGTTFEYSNVTFTVLAELIQIVTGQPFESYVQSHIFEPLGMRQSFMSQVEAQRHEMAVGYRGWFGVPVPADLPQNRGALYMYSSAEDLANYLISNLNDGHFGARSIVSEQGMAELQRPVAREGESFWGMGWEVGSRFGIPTLFKNGDTPNFHGDLIMVPEGRWGVILLTNGQRSISSALGDRPVSAITAGVARLLVGQQPQVPTSRIPLALYGILLIAIVLQLLWVMKSAALMRRWRREPSRRPRGLRAFAWLFGLPIALQLTWALVTLVGLPSLFHLPLSTVLFAAADLGYSALLNGVIALGWGIIWAGQALFLVRHPGIPTTAEVPANAAPRARKIA